jgi:hypothetical protein
MAPESAAAIFVAYATFLPLFAYACHALCVATYVVPHRARRSPGSEVLPLPSRGQAVQPHSRSPSCQVSSRLWAWAYSSVIFTNPCWTSWIILAPASVLTLIPGSRSSFSQWWTLAVGATYVAVPTTTACPGAGVAYPLHRLAQAGPAPRPGSQQVTLMAEDP